MKAIYTDFNTNEKTYCDFCPISNEDKGHWRIETMSLETNKPIGLDYACDDCHTKFKDGSLPKCDECGKLFRHRHRKECFYCNTYKPKYGNEPAWEFNETIEMGKQIHELTQEKEQLKEDVEIAISALGTAEKWDSRKELIEENKKLKEQLEAYKQRRLSDENKTLKEQITILRSELLQLQNKLEAQVEVLPK
jgi:hypothetical protein